MKNKLRRAAALMLALAMAFTVISCGKKEETGDGTPGQTSGDAAGQETPEWVYVPQFVDMKTEGMYSNMCQVGDYLYYPTSGWDEETGTSLSGVCKYSLADGSKEEIPLGSDGGSISSVYVAADGSIYAVAYYYSMDGNGNFNNWQSLVKYDAEGNEVYNTGISEIMTKENASYVASLAADESGRAYVACDSSLLLFDANGDYTGCVQVGDGSAGSRVSSVGFSADKKVYVCYSEGGVNYRLAELDPDKKTLGEPLSFSGGSGNSLNAGPGTDFITHDGSSVYAYDIATQTSQELFKWIDSDINGMYVTSVGVMSDGRIVAVTYDWSANEAGLVLLTKTSAGEVTIKKTVVIGTMYKDYELSQAAVDFNKNSDEYRVTIKTYIDENADWNENTWSDARTRLYNDIISGNCPDIINVGDQMDVDSLAEKGLFEDLTAYLEKSSVLSREDYLEQILDASTYHGVLVGIPKYFQVSTVLGRSSDVGSKMGWSLKDVEALADKNPDKMLSTYGDAPNILYFCLRYSLGSFVDPDTGACSFDSPEFLELLKFAKRAGKPVDYDNAYSYARLQKGDILLNETTLDSFDDIQLFSYVFEGDVTAIGFPTVDGSVGCAMYMNAAYGITSSSQKKEGAWAFIEYYLSSEEERQSWSSGFPSNRQQLQKEFEASYTVEYMLDENGEKILDENGDPILIGFGTRMVTYADGWSYTYRPATEEEALLVMDLIETIKPAPYWNNDVYGIVIEEALAFLEGDKSAEEVADIIQSRVRLFVSESR